MTQIGANQLKKKSLSLLHPAYPLKKKQTKTQKKTPKNNQPPKNSNHPNTLISENV